MTYNPDDFRRVYESLNDEALLAVKRDELVPVAQQVYDAEVASRGLAGGVTASEHSTGEPEAEVAAGAIAPTEELVALATFTDVDDARMALALLKGAEIPCYLQNDDPMAVSMLGNPGGGSFRLSVPPAWVEDAQAVLDSEISEEDLAAQAEAAGEFEEEAEEDQEEV